MLFRSGNSGNRQGAQEQQQPGKEQQPQKPQGENRRHDRQQRKDRNRRLKPGDKPDNTAPGEGRNARQDVAPAMSPSKRMLNQNGDNGN